MEPAEEPVLRYLWRSISWRWRIFGGLVLLGLAAWGVSGIVDGWRRAQLREEIRVYLAALPPVPPEPLVPDGDNAAPVLLDAMAAARKERLRVPRNRMSLSGKAISESEVAALMEGSAEAVRLLEAALGKAAFAPGPSPPGAMPPPVDSFDLLEVVRTRSVVQFRTGHVGEAVATALLAPRFARRVGSGRAPPWISIPAYGDAGVLEVLEAAVADPRLDGAGAEAILRDLPSGEEARAAAMATFDAMSIRFSGNRFMEYLGDDAEGKARADGWRPPTPHERLLLAIRKVPLPPGVEPWPTVGQFREMWKFSTDHRVLFGLRGEAAVRRFGPIPPNPSGASNTPDRDASFAWEVRTQMGIEARLEAIRAAAALRLFEMRNGRTPGSLEELVPALLPARIRDPYAEGPLRYQADGDGWEISTACPAGEWASAFINPPVIRWKRPAPLPQDGGR